MDVDSEIEKREGMSIPLIFEKKGEEYFRDLEIRVLRDLAGEGKGGYLNGWRARLEPGSDGPHEKERLRCLDRGEF
ncbi:MAG: shikimate kinase [Aquificota bacterium]|nr:shikimate kinase [Aquificota bacterium]